MKVTLLGCGSSMGVPSVGLGWGACNPADPRNRRRRASLLVETDAPYLAPVPYRGKRNEPAFVATTAAFVATLKDMEEGALAAATTANFFRLFAKAQPPR